MKAAILGLGFVGLTTALGLCEKGHTVKGFDTDNIRRELLERGETPIFEPEINAALGRHLNKNFFLAGSTLEAACDSEIILLCVGTPSRDDGSADLSQLFSALNSVIPALCDGRFRVLAIKSTIPPGTTQNEIIPHLADAPGDFSVAYNPEFLREGRCWDDFIEPDRVVCGVGDERAADALLELYAPFETPVRLVSHSTAEFIKYLSNTLLSTLISYSNEMSLIADAIGDINIGDAFKILHEDKRWHGAEITSYIYPGCGFGGYCLPKDTLAIAARAEALGVEPRMLRAVLGTNKDMPAVTVKKIRRLTPLGAPVGILGLSFKPGSDDARDSPAAKIIERLISEGYSPIYAHDPVANAAFSALFSFSDIHYCETAEQVCESSDCVVLVTTWPEYKRIVKKYPGKVIVDCRYFL